MKVTEKMYEDARAEQRQLEDEMRREGGFLTSDLRLCSLRRCEETIDEFEDAEFVKAGL